jgi:uncharacterized YccA/Bax inhibitor family protein
MRTGNPVLTEDVFRAEAVAYDADAMTLQGTVTKTGILLALTVGAAAASWMHIAERPDLATIYLFGGMISGLVLAFATSFKPAWSAVTAPIYALCEGLFLGAASLVINTMVVQQTGKSIVPQAVALTLGTLASLLVAYSAGLIRATEKFKAGVMAATGAIFLFYLVCWVLRFFSIEIPYVHEGGLIGIGFSLFVIVVAALNLVLDFDMIETGVRQNAPKYMEWYGGFALLVTLVWLYIEFLKLLAKMQKRN